MADRERRTRIDPAVAGILDNLHQTQARRNKKKPQARMAQAEDRRQAEQRRQVLRSRVIYDLPQDISQAVRELADELECPDSQVAAFLLQHALRLAGEIDWEQYKVSSKSPRRRFNLQIPSEVEE